MTSCYSFSLNKVKCPPKRLQNKFQLATTLTLGILGKFISCQVGWQGQQGTRKDIHMRKISTLIMKCIFYQKKGNFFYLTKHRKIGPNN